jgi:hypothetical protein
MPIEKFAGLVAKIDDVVIAKITSVSSPNLSISTADITGSEDVASGGDILTQQLASIMVGETASLEGIVIIGDSGQSDLYDAAKTGATVELSWVGASGNGASLEGIFTSYSETRGTGDVAKFTSAFHVNENTAIVAGS